MPAYAGAALERGFAGLNHGLLYCISSLVLGIELNIVGPTAASLAAQVGVDESALGGVVGLGGIGLLVGGIPSGWLLDKLPGHTVLASATALQALTFCILPHCASLLVLAITYCAAALTFNAITTGANALILWRYPGSQAAWLNLASALFGVGCFLAPVLADVATRAHGGQQHGPSGGAGGGAGVGGAAPFRLGGGGAELAYYAVAAGAAMCSLWAACLPSPPRPDPHSHHHHTTTTGNTGLQAEAVDARDGSDGSPAEQGQADAEAGQVVAVLIAVKERVHKPGSSSSGGSSPLLARSPSFASVLDMSGLESSATDSPATSTNGQSRSNGPSFLDPQLVPTAGCTDDRASSASGMARTACTVSGAGSTWCSCSSMSTLADQVVTAASTAAPVPAPEAPDGAAFANADAAAAAAAAAATAEDVDGGSGSSTEGGFGSALSSSLASAGEVSVGDSVTCVAACGDDGGSHSNPLYGATAAASAATAAAPGAVTPDAADLLSAAAAQIKALQQQRDEQLRQRQLRAQSAPNQGCFADRAEDSPASVVSAEPLISGCGGGCAWPNGGQSGLAAGQRPASTVAAVVADGEVGTHAGRRAQACSGATGGCGGAVGGSGGGGGSSALFRRYMHELRMGWPVLLPVVLLLFANISTQASFGAWVTTYCRLAAGLDESGAQAVTAAYWAAFTGTRLAGVAVAPLLHASSVLLITSPFAVAGAAMAILGLPQIPGLVPHASETIGAGAFAASLPLWALYTAVCLVGVGVATGFANTVSLTGDHLRLDGFTNGILSSVAGLASTLCPAAVPWLARHTGMGYGALMVVALGMSGVQLAMVVAALVGARWVDEWQRKEEEEEEEEKERGEEEEVVVVVAGRDGSGWQGERGELTEPLLRGRGAA